MKALIKNIEGLVYDEDVNELYLDEIVEVLTLDFNNEFALVKSKNGIEHGIDLERIEIITIAK
jgi:hypothetical protein